MIFTVFIALIIYHFLTKERSSSSPSLTPEQLKWAMDEADRQIKEAHKRRNDQIAKDLAEIKTKRDIREQEAERERRAKIKAQINDACKAGIDKANAMLIKGEIDQEEYQRAINLFLDEMEKEDSL